ncbi:MAG: four helix bundle protein [Planctomycetes bacterium]|jgi:hypothetical protein|nr:four helix bundle protein [Planctomycetota bacterium]
MNVPSPRHEPRRAPDELLVLQRAEELATFVLQRSGRWPKSQRHTTTRRLEDHVLDVVDDLVIARYDKAARRARLDGANLRLERARFVLACWPAASCARPPTTKASRSASTMSAGCCTAGARSCARPDREADWLLAASQI